MRHDSVHGNPKNKHARWKLYQIIWINGFFLSVSLRKNLNWTYSDESWYWFINIVGGFILISKIRQKAIFNETAKWKNQIQLVPVKCRLMHHFSPIKRIRSRSSDDIHLVKWFWLNQIIEPIQWFRRVLQGLPVCVACRVPYSQRPSVYK